MQKKRVRLIGDRSLSKRDFLRVTKPLENFGANLKTSSGKLPITVTGTKNPVPIRYYENGIYYHGIGINDTPSWNTNNKFDKCFFVYHSGRELPRKDIDTYEPNSFCCNCTCNVELTKGRPKNKIYSCLGHKIL